jgi:hypothetical protein
MLNTRRRGKSGRRFVKMKMLSTCHQVYIFGRLGNKKKKGGGMNYRLHNCQQSLHI